MHVQWSITFKLIITLTALTHTCLFMISDRGQELIKGHLPTNDFLNPVMMSRCEICLCPYLGADGKIQLI